MIFRQRDPSQDQDVSIQSTEDASITRNFRYMRRKPTIISYQPPPGDLDEDGNQLPQLSDIVVDSDHMILDCVQGNSILYQPFISYQPPLCDLDEDSNQLQQLFNIVIDSDHMFFDHRPSGFVPRLTMSCDIVEQGRNRLSLLQGKDRSEMNVPL